MRFRRAAGLLGAALLIVGGGSCLRGTPAPEVVCYCSIDEPYAGRLFAEFERQTGIHVNPQYDIETSKSVGLAGKLEAERDHPRADVWWGSEAFLSVRLADERVLAPYQPPTANDIPAVFKDADGYWTGEGLRARVLAVGTSPTAVPPFPITSLQDLADSRLKDKVCISHPTAGATGAHFAMMYVVWGPERARAFLAKLHDNNVAQLGGNAEVADQVGAGIYAVGLTDSDDVANAQANGGRETLVVPDQQGEGTLAMPTTIGLVAGGPHPELAKRLIDFLASAHVEQELIDMKFARWSVRATGDAGIKAVDVDYRAAAKVYGRAQREATAILEGRPPE